MQSINGIGGIGSEVLPIGVAKESGKPGSFEGALGDALKAVEDAQQDGDKESAKLAMGGGNLHETALALEKADLTMRVATKVRNRLVDAYSEIMRMPV
jgi:flagellar hook-basal body complex protein FliE